MHRIVLFLFLVCSGSLIAQDFYDINVVKDIKLTFEQDDWSRRLDSLKYLGTKERLLATLEIDGVRYDSVGVRYKGNSSFYNVKQSDSPKLPFNIKIDYVKKDQKIAGKYEKIKLSNVFRDPSFMREALSYEIARKYMPASRCNFARVYINGELIGLYDNVESVEDAFLEEHFGNDDGVFIKCDPEEIGEAKKLPKDAKSCKIGDYASLNYVGDDPLCYQRLYEVKSKIGWKELITLTQKLKEQPEKVAEYLNVDQVLWMHAFNNVLVNLDSYSGRLCHNYYMYQDTFGVFHPIIWDLNLSFGGFRFADAEGALDNQKMQKMSPFLHYKNENRPLISQLLQTPLYRKLYVAHMQTILRDNFSNGEYSRRMQQMQQLLDFYVKNDPHKLYEYETFKNNIESSASAGKASIIGIKELMEARTRYLTTHPLFVKEQPQIARPNHQVKSDTVTITSKVNGAVSVYLAYRSQKYAAFTYVPMYDDGKHGDYSADDGFYGVQMPQADVLHYYIIAEAEKTAKVSPERASWEYYEVK